MQPSLGASRLAFCRSPEAAAPEPCSVAAHRGGHTGGGPGSAFCRAESCVPPAAPSPAAQRGPPASDAGFLIQPEPRANCILASALLFQYIYFNRHLKQPEPEPISTTAFVAKTDRFFHYLHAACSRTTSRACFPYKFPSFLPAIERGDLKRGRAPGEDVCFGNRPITLICRTWQVKPLRSACIGTVQGLEKILLLVITYSPSPAALVRRRDTVQPSPVTSSISIAHRSGGGGLT